MVDAPKLKLCNEDVDFARALPFKMRFFRRLSEQGVFGGTQETGELAIESEKLFPFFKCIVWELFPEKEEKEIERYADDIPIAEMQPLIEWAQKEMEKAGFSDIDRPT